MALATYLALLRGINVGGRGTVRMEDLRALVAGLGHDRVQTYIQSGNVIFQGEEAEPEAVALAIEERMARDWGRAVPVLVLTAQRLAHAANGNPFAGADPRTLHVTFLAGPPALERLAAIRAADHLPDAFRVVGREVYLHCPQGYGNTTLTNGFFEARLGVRATTRNWNTVTRLQGLVAAGA